MNLADTTKKKRMGELTASQALILESGRYESNSRQALQSFAQSTNQSFHQLAQMSEGLVVVFDKKLELINDIFAELFGVSPEEACSPSFDPMTLVAPESQRFIWKQYQKGCRGDFQTKEINYTGLSSDGQKIECETLLLFIPYKNGVAIQCTLNRVSVSRRIDEVLKRHYSDLPVSMMGT